MHSTYIQLGPGICTRDQQQMPMPKTEKRRVLIFTFTRPSIFKTQTFNPGLRTASDFNVGIYRFCCVPRPKFSLFWFKFPAVFCFLVFFPLFPHVSTVSLSEISHDARIFPLVLFKKGEKPRWPPISWLLFSTYHTKLFHLPYIYYNKDGEHICL